MNRVQVLAVVLGFACFAALGCGSKAPEVSGSSKAPEAPGGGETPTDPNKVPAAKSSGPTLAGLLGKIPKDKAPKNKDDNDGMEITNMWLKENAVGHRVSWVGLSSEWFSFNADGNGTYTAWFIHDPSKVTIPLHGTNWPLTLFSNGQAMAGGRPGILVAANGLSEKTVKRLRVWPKGKPLEISFEIVSAKMYDDGLRAAIDEVVLRGFERYDDLTDDARTELDLLQGTWRLAGIEVNGKAIPKEQVPKMEAVITPDGRTKTYRWTSSGVDTSYVRTVVNPKKDPKVLDSLKEEGESKGKWTYGIYQLESDKLTMCVSEEGAAEKDRPTDFAKAPSLFILQRVK